MLSYFMFRVESRTSFMTLTLCCHFHVLLRCTAQRPLGWMTAFIQNFTGADKKIKRPWMVFCGDQVEVLSLDKQ